MPRLWHISLGTACRKVSDVIHVQLTHTTTCATDVAYVQLTQTTTRATALRTGPGKEM